MRLHPLELADLHIDALYERDAAGLVIASRDPHVTPPPFHLVRTRVGNRWLLSARLEPARRQLLASILARQPPISDCTEELPRPEAFAAMRSVLAEYSKSHGEYRGPAYFFPDELPNADQAELLIDVSEVPESGPFSWLRTFVASWHPIAVLRAADGTLASVCHSARSTHGAAEAGVETVDEYRGRGYGSTAVSAWAAAVRRGGRLPLYSTSWVNTPSRALARRLGLVAYAEDFHV